MDIQIQDGISEKDWQVLTGWKERVFPDEGRGIEWSPSRWHVMARDDQKQPVAHLGFDLFEFVVDEKQRYLCNGVGGVVVVPEYQGQGFPKQLFQALHTSDEILARTSIFSLLCPHRLVSYYAKFGYQVFDGDMSYPQTGGMSSNDKFHFMVRSEEISGKHIRLCSPPW